jgi:hypothetical protein
VSYRDYSLSRVPYEEGIVAGIEIKSFSSPDEIDEFPKARMETLRLGDGVVMRMVLEPGWKFSEHGGTPTCEDPHFLYQQSGRMRVVTHDGTEAESGPGDIVRIEPDHDAWVVGDEYCVFLDFAFSVA